MTLLEAIGGSLTISACLEQICDNLLHM